MRPVLTVILCETNPPPRISPALIGSRCSITKSLAGCNGGMGDEAEQGSRSDEKPVLGISGSLREDMLEVSLLSFAFLCVQLYPYAEPPN
jgi:hypothetical protein